MTTYLTIGNPDAFFTELSTKLAQLPGDLAAGLATALNSVPFSAKGVGVALQGIGQGLRATGGPVAEIVGRSLDAYGKALEHGTPIATEPFSPALLAEAGVSLAAGAAATALAAYLGTVGFAFAAGISPVAAMAIAGAAAAGFPIIAGVAVAALAVGISLVVDAALGIWVNPLLRRIMDPLILDLDGDGIETSALAGSNVFFDYDSDGVAERTGWASADDGMLAYDANGNGVVDGIDELFGSPSQDGFEVLETLDRNQDGTIDAADAAYSQLRVWRDLDQDGVPHVAIRRPLGRRSVVQSSVHAGELQSLADAGIAALALSRSKGGAFASKWGAHAHA